MIGARAGDNDQVVALAEAIGLPFEIKQLEFNRLCHLGPRLLGRSMASLTESSRVILTSEEPPDLIISTGHRSVPAVQALRKRSNGATRSIHVGFPRISPAKFDLVIATPQYPIAEHPNLMRVPFALTRAATSPEGRTAPADRSLLAGVPQPRRLLTVGGPTLFWNLDDGAVLRTLAAMLDEARAEGGSVLVTTSPRTPAGLERQLADELATSGVPSLLAIPGKAPGYASLLEVADSIHVTVDSVSMVSDAIWTGKPMALVPIEKSPSGRMVTALTDKLRRGRRLYPQDLRFFWKALAEIDIGEQLAVPNVSRHVEMRRVLDRVQPILKN